MTDSELRAWHATLRSHALPPTMSAHLNEVQEKPKKAASKKKEDYSEFA